MNQEDSSVVLRYFDTQIVKLQKKVHEVLDENNTNWTVFFAAMSLSLVLSGNIGGAKM